VGSLDVARAGGDATKPAVDVVVPVRDAMRYLPRTLPAFLAACERYGPAVIVLADNGSTDGSLAFARQWLSPNLRLLEVPGLAVGAVRNRAAAACSGDLVVFLDADCLVDDDYLINVERAFASRRLDAAGCRYSLPPDPHWIEEAWDQLHWPIVEGSVPYINAGNFVVRREVLRASGGFDEILRSGEDAEFCFRLCQGGWSVTQTEAIRAVHLGNPTTVTGFFKKQLWHGQGAMGTARLQRVDKPVLMTLVHWMLLPGASLLALSWSEHPYAQLAVVSSAPLVAPVATVLYRVRNGGSTKAALPGLLLYLTYFSARGIALAQLGLRAFQRRIREVGSRTRCDPTGQSTVAPGREELTDTSLR
jgi:cellulose synthase/poly-beta-1,6-N-acetylglucosamine synthase-like glycosyltransferase